MSNSSACLAAALFVAAVSCHGACGADVEPVSMGRPRSPKISTDSSVTSVPDLLASDREVFWSKLIGAAPGQPGSEALGWCLGSLKQDAERVVGPDLTLQIQNRGSHCALIAWGLREDPTGVQVAELDAVLSRWGPPSWAVTGRETWIDERNRLVATVTRVYRARPASKPSQINVHWHAYVPLERIVGVQGEALAGIDFKLLLRRNAPEIQRATLAPYRVDRCDEHECQLTGPSPPGGELSRISSAVMRGRNLVIASLVPAPHDLKLALELLDRSLGPREPTVSGTDRAERWYHRDGLRYLVSIVDHRYLQIEVQR